MFNMCFKYLDDIVQSLNCLYRTDYELFNGYTHEQTFTFRIALYLSQYLENPKYKIDCEYHRDIYNESGHKQIVNTNGETLKIRPDIIYHDRAQHNKFCIEVKKGSVRNDKQKVSYFINQYRYDEGYCIYNLGKNYVTIVCIKYSKGELVENVIRYKFSSDKKCLIPAKNEDDEYEPL